MLNPIHIIREAAVNTPLNSPEWNTLVHAAIHAGAAKELLAITPKVTVTSLKRFETFMLNGLEWQQVAAIKTATGKYRVEITWALDRYRVSVYRRVQEPEKLVRVHRPLYARTAVATANKLLKYYEQNGY